ncbi:MAG: alpha/beta fold hydrolase [Gammaproteobacteria bacterium]|nr:MAG: alpha/beta fold hydrolase [Gammaproteobacteria bacterium]
MTGGPAGAGAFRPSRWLGNRHLQSVLPSLPLRRRFVERRARRLIGASRQLLLECGGGVRLLAAYAPPTDGVAASPRRLTVLLHGWEGSADSLYLLSVAQLLYARGCGVVRLNLRDHGGTHALNAGLFHSCRLDEVIGAIRHLQALFPAARLALAGFSLGGNFMLRVGARAAPAGLRLERIVAVCPVLDPAATLVALESGPALYRRYFLFKWRRSLRAKQLAWPSDYDFRELLGETSLTAMTERMVLRYTEFPDLASYLRGYAITGPVLADLAVPTHLVAAADDPVIPVSDLDGLARTPALRVTVTGRGGHCGFVERLRGASWIDRVLADELAG